MHHANDLFTISLVAHTLPGRASYPKPKPVNKCA